MHAMPICLVFAILLPTAAFAEDFPIEVNATQMAVRYGARSSPEVEDVHKRMQTSINCLVGPNGDGFSQDARNPCAASGNGLIPDSADADKKAKYSEVVAKLRAGLLVSDFDAARKVCLEAADMIVAISAQ
jgi:hypothetical protein